MIQPKGRAVVAINATGGAFTDIVATIWCRRVEIVEEALAGGGETVLQQGLQYKLPGDGFTAVHTQDAGQPIVLGEPNHLGCSGPLLGKPAQSSPSISGTGVETIAATVLCKVLSMNLATNVRVSEYN